VSSVRRVTDGVPSKLDESKRKQRIKQIGNAVVPRIAEIIGRAILESIK
jgi:site-specific DNA-cytosine methylase